MGALQCDSPEYLLDSSWKGRGGVLGLGCGKTNKLGTGKGERSCHEDRTEATETVLKCADVEVDPTAKVVRQSGNQVTMTAKEFQLLKLLMERAGKYVTKSDIEYALYSAESAVESNTTEVTIYNLRKKLGSDFIKSIRGVGYMVEA